MGITIGCVVHDLYQSVNRMRNATPWGNSVNWGSVYTPAEELVFRGFINLGTVDTRAYYGLQLSGAPLSGDKRKWGRIVESKYDPYADWQNYANPVGDILHRGLASLPYIPHGEHLVRHTSLRGDLYPSGTGYYTVYDRDFPFYGETIKVSNKCNPTNTSLGVHLTTQSAPGSDAGYGYYANNVLGSVAHLLRYQKTGRDDIPQSHIVRGPNGDQFWGSPSHGSSDASVSLGEGSVTLRYTGFRWSNNVVGLIGVRYESTIVITCEKVSGGPLGFWALGNALTVRRTVAYSDRVTSYTGLSVPGGIAWSAIPGWSNRSSFVSASSVLKLWNGSQPVTFALRKDSEIDYAKLNDLMEDKLKGIEKGLSSLGPQLRPGSCISTNDALNSFRTDSNWIESILELHEVTQLIVGPAEVGSKFMSALRRSPFKRWRGLPGFLSVCLDTIAGLTLLYNFGVSPLMSDIDSLLSLKSTLERLSKVFAQPYTARGRHAVQLSIDGNTYDVVFRSKLRFPVPTVGLAVDVLTLDSVGALPLPSRFWAAKPLAFLLDYVLHIGDRMSIVEGFFFLCAWGANLFVHSYTLTLEGAKDFVPEGFEAPDGFSLKFYVREPSCFIPDPMRSSDFNLIPPRGPSLSTFLSLLWVFSSAAVNASTRLLLGAPPKTSNRRGWWRLNNFRKRG